jgi:hypothetical protein
MARFFAEHNIPFAMLESGAFGSLRTSGCAPLGCGADTAFIGVRVNRSPEGVWYVPRLLVNWALRCMTRPTNAVTGEVTCYFESPEDFSSFGTTRGFPSDRPWPAAPRLL